MAYVRQLVENKSLLNYADLCTALIEQFGVVEKINFESLLPSTQQQQLFGGEILRLIAEHPSFNTQKDIRPIGLMKGSVSQLLFFFVRLNEGELSKSVIQRITTRFIRGSEANRFIIWFFGNKDETELKVVLSGKDRKKISLRTLPFGVKQPYYKTYDYILNEVRSNIGGRLFVEPTDLWKTLWKAFDISIVNKKFYDEIKQAFDSLFVELNKTKQLFASDEEKVQFATRLIGRIIFCWFLKKKGIIGNEALSSDSIGKFKNYYHDLLELLFFEVFNKPEDERELKKLPSEIASYKFLNGGLFEDHVGDHKGDFRLVISNDWFYNFFFRTLERYNFTVDENSSSNAEIAIDPEMLGRIFENLLAEQNPETGESARKATGSYYTPREIVDYMVEQTITEYLKKYLGNYTEQKLEIKQNLFGAIPNQQLEIPKAEKIKLPSNWQDTVEELVHTNHLDDSLKPISKYLLDALNRIKIIDPACGSGAFPMGVLQKLLALKKEILDQTASTTKKKKSIEPYQLKLDTIQNSIYGVDIQPMAVELSRLRCWLSLVVDEDVNDLHPLPNLDFKFVCANSLIDVPLTEYTRNILSDEMQELELNVSKYFSPEFHQKEKIKSAIKNIIASIIAKNNQVENRIKSQIDKSVNTAKAKRKQQLNLELQKYQELEFRWKSYENIFNDRSAAFFSPEFFFPSAKSGFDIVIANPPYIGEKGNEKIFQEVARTEFGKKYYTRWMDYFYFFFHKGIDLLKPNGTLAFITTNYFFTSTGGNRLRADLKNRTSILSFINFNELKIFDSARGQHNSISILCKNKDEESISHNIETIRVGNATDEILNSIVYGSDSESEYMSISQADLFEGSDFQIRIKGKGDANSNSMSIHDILQKIGRNNPSLNKITNITMGIVTLSDTVSSKHLSKYNLGVSKGTGIYVLNDMELKSLNLTKDEKQEFIKPFFKNSDIGRYYCKTANNLWLIYTKDKGEPISLPSGIKAHFDKFKPLLVDLKSNFLKNEIAASVVKKWFANGNYFVLFTPKKQEYFTGAKIITSYRSKSNCFCYSETPYFGSKDIAYVLPLDKSFNLKYILAILNSKLIFKWLYYKGKRKGETLELYAKPLGDIPIKKTDSEIQDMLASIVETILNTKKLNPKADTIALEHQIDMMVYHLYDLTYEEARIIEPELKIEEFEMYRLPETEKTGTQ